MKLLIKNMVCRHCVGAVSKVVDSIPGLHAQEVGLGYLNLLDKPDDAQMQMLESRLSEEGFEIIQSRESELVEGVKRVLIDRVLHNDAYAGINVSKHLADTLGASYSVLSRLFSEVEGRTIENYLKSLRVERVKELIKYERMSLAEIADAVGYSSESHLSRSFKQVTGMTPGAFRTLGHRTPLPEV